MTTSTQSDEFFNPLNPLHIADPDDYMYSSRKGCPVSQVSDILYAVNSDQGVRQVFDDTEHFSNRGNFTVAEDLDMPYPVITMADPPVHTALRTRLLKDLAPARLRKLRPRIEQIISEAITKLPSRGRVDLYSDYVQSIPAAVLYALIGIPTPDWTYVQNLSDFIVEKVPAPVTELPEYAQLTDYLRERVEERRANPNERQEDVLDNLCFAGAAETDMATEEVLAHVLQLLAAATDTTRALITNCVYRMLEHPDQWKAVLANRSLLANAVEESLRFDAPAQFMVRNVVRDVTIGGCPVKVRKKVYLNIQSANHDEERWGEQSRSFRVDRANAMTHLSFGRGIHACIGAPVARIEATVAIDALLDRYPNMVLDPRARWVKCKGALFRRVDSLPVLLTGEPQ